MRFRYIVFAGLLPVLFLATARADECDPNDPTLLKPGFTSLAPKRARVLQKGADRQLYFSSLLANVGPGPLTLQAQTVQTPSGPVTQATQVIQRTDGSTCTHVAGYFEFHPSHHHFHINDIAEYQLRKDDPLTGQVVARASKISFCLIDVQPLRGFSGQRQVVSDCSVQEGTQGISVGWADVYDDFYPEQSIDLDPDANTHVPAGGYFLVNVADPDHLLLKADDSLEATAGYVSVSVPSLIGVPSGGGTSGGGTGRPPRPPHPVRPPRPPQQTGSGPTHPAHPVHPTHNQ